MPDTMFNTLNINKNGPNELFMNNCGTKGFDQIELKEMHQLSPAPVKGIRERLQTVDMTSPLKSTEGCKVVPIKDKKIKK